MGVYINPPGETKEAFLEREGVELSVPEWPDDKDATLLVCLVDNGPFTAAAVAYKKSEYDEFTRTDDPRPKRWFLIDLKTVLDVLPGMDRKLLEDKRR